MLPWDSQAGRTRGEHGGRMLETVATFDNLVAADMAKNMLIARGIDAVIEDAETAAMFWHLSNAIGGIKLRARTEDAERARDALDGFDGVRPIAEDDAIAATPATAKQLAAQEVPEPFDEETPTDKTLDRAFR